jgi:hypothetical protein
VKRDLLQCQKRPTTEDRLEGQREYRSGSPPARAREREREREGERERGREGGREREGERLLGTKLHNVGVQGVACRPSLGESGSFQRHVRVCVCVCV